MLTLDEAWLTHTARINAHATVLPEDVWLEDVLFAIEALLERTKSELVPQTRLNTDSEAAPAPSGSGRFQGSQPH
jgi:hypothetical protein